MITKSIPSLFTVGNLFLGVIAIILVFPENEAGSSCDDGHYRYADGWCGWTCRTGT